VDSDNFKTETDQFIFNPINEEFVNKEINKIGIKKATGKDGISSKILKLSKSVVAKPISKIINKSFETSTFPDKLKEINGIKNKLVSFSFKIV
jgi:hypothetical protein